MRSIIAGHGACSGSAGGSGVVGRHAATAAPSTKGQARIRTQLSASHDRPTLERALEAFKKVGDKYGILGLDKKAIIEKYGM